jgi:hypothetical protein
MIKCKGCGNEIRNGMSREHVLPQWLHKHVQVAGQNLDHRVADMAGIRPLRRHGLKSFVVKVVCASCNNTWMSALETEAKPVLLPLIEGKRRVEDLSDEEASTLARWTFKTAFMILSVQSNHAVPWHLFERWAQGGAGHPNPALIFALSDPQINEGFYYTTDGDFMRDAPTQIINLRTGICIRSLILITLLPTDERPREPAAQGTRFKLLWPPHMRIIEVQAHPVSSELGYPEFMKEITGRVYAGVSQSLSR